MASSNQSCRGRIATAPRPRRLLLPREYPANPSQSSAVIGSSCHQWRHDVICPAGTFRRHSSKKFSRKITWDGDCCPSGVPTVIGFLSGGTSIIAKNRPIPMLDFLLIIAAAETGPVERFRQDVTLLIFRRKETARNKRHTVAIGFALDLKWAVGGAHEPPGTARAVEPAYRSCRPG